MLTMTILYFQNRVICYCTFYSGKVSQQYVNHSGRKKQKILSHISCLSDLADFQFVHLRITDRHYV